MSVVEIANLRAKQDAADGLRNVLPDALAILASGEGCLDVSSYRCVEHSLDFILVVTWSSVAAHMTFRDSPAMGEFRSLIAGHLEEAPTALHYELL